jgi:hypothetical protein
MTLDISILDDMIELVEAAIPANPSSAENKKLVKKTEEIMAAYFKSLEQAFPYQQLEAIYNKHVTVKEQAGTGEANDIMAPILRMFRAKLLTDLVGQHVTAYLSGSAQLTSWGSTQRGIPIAYEGPAIQHAIDYAQRHCAELVTNMDEESRRLIAETVSNAIENKRGIPGLARDLRNQFADMTRYRSELIAKSETRDALFHASQDRMEAMGVTGKEWILGSGGREGNCEYCKRNADAGIIPIEEEFPTPQYEIHPGCTCAIAPAMIKKGD